jgi:hypothetical protein
MLDGGRREKEREGDSPLHSCMRAYEWSSLCWQVETERQGKGRRKVALEREQDWLQDPQGIPLISWKY